MNSKNIIILTKKNKNNQIAPEACRTSGGNRLGKSMMIKETLIAMGAREVDIDNYLSSLRPQIDEVAFDDCLSDKE